MARALGFGRHSASLSPVFFVGIKIMASMSSISTARIIRNTTSMVMSDASLASVETEEELDVIAFVETEEELDVMASVENEEELDVMAPE